MLSAAYVVAITDLQMPATVSSQAGANDDGRRPRFLSNGIMVKLTPQARASLRTSGEDVNPAATGLSVLDAIDRDHGVKGSPPSRTQCRIETQLPRSTAGSSSPCRAMRSGSR
jgi:hypothetical protein